MFHKLITLTKYSYRHIFMATVLIVDDSTVQKLVISRILTKLNLAHITAKNGKEGVEKALQHKPDLILMDIVMPDCNGYQALRLLKKNEETKAIPVIVVSTKSLRVDRIWAERQGAADYIVKPINEAELVEKVKKYCPV